MLLTNVKTGDDKHIQDRLIEYVNKLLKNSYDRSVSPDQKLILTKLWEGNKLNDIATNSGNSLSYLKSIAQTLWDLLSYCLDTEINSNNFRSILIDRFPDLTIKASSKLDRNRSPQSQSNYSPKKSLRQVRDCQSFFPKTEKARSSIQLNKFSKNQLDPEIPNLVDFIDNLLVSNCKNPLTPKKKQIVIGILSGLLYKEIGEKINTPNKIISHSASQVFTDLSDIFKVKIGKKTFRSTLTFYYNKSQLSQTSRLTTKSNPNYPPSAYISSATENFKPIPIKNTLDARPLVLILQVSPAEQSQFDNLDNSPVIKFDPDSLNNNPINSQILNDAIAVAIHNLPHLRDRETITVPLKLKIVSNP